MIFALRIFTFAVMCLVAAVSMPLGLYAFFLIVAFAYGTLSAIYGYNLRGDDNA